jgi:hypothetical protein
MCNHKIYSLLPKMAAKDGDTWIAAGHEQTLV